MKREELAINSIGQSYRTGTAAGISDEEVKQYVHSVEFLEDILRFSKTAFLVIEFKTWSYVYCSNNAQEVIGHSPEELMIGGPKFGLKRLHPKDLITQGEIHPAMVDFFMGLDSPEKNRHKFSFTSRVIHKDGRVVQLLQHNFFLKWDDHGNPLLKLITFTDITPYKTNNDVVFYVSRLLDDGSSELVSQKNFSGSKDIAMSNRELEVLQLLSKGHSAKQIAACLTMAESTVKNHRKSIIKKMGCRNSAQMVTLAGLYGFVPLKEDAIRHVIN